MPTALSPGTFNIGLLIVLILLTSWLVSIMYRLYSYYTMTVAYHSHRLIHVEGIGRHSGLSGEHLSSILRARSRHLPVQTPRLALLSHIPMALSMPLNGGTNSNYLLLQLPIYCQRLTRVDVVIGLPTAIIHDLYRTNKKFLVSPSKAYLSKNKGKKGFNFSTPRSTTDIELQPYSNSDSKQNNDKVPITENSDMFRSSSLSTTEDTPSSSSVSGHSYTASRYDDSIPFDTSAAIVKLPTVLVEPKASDSDKSQTFTLHLPVIPLLQSISDGAVERHAIVVLVRPLDSDLPSYSEETKDSIPTSAGTNTTTESHWANEVVILDGSLSVGITGLDSPTNEFDGRSPSAPTPTPTATPIKSPRFSRFHKRLSSSPSPEPPLSPTSPSSVGVSDSVRLRWNRQLVYSTSYYHNPIVYELQELYGFDSDSIDCIACLTEVKDLILLPCRHVSICHQCHRHVTKCPVCRAPILNYLQFSNDGAASDGDGKPKELKADFVVNGEKPVTPDMMSNGDVRSTEDIDRNDENNSGNGSIGSTAIGATGVNEPSKTPEQPHEHRSHLSPSPSMDSNQLSAQSGNDSEESESKQMPVSTTTITTHTNTGGGGRGGEVELQSVPTDVDRTTTPSHVDTRRSNSVHGGSPVFHDESDESSQAQ